MTIFEIKVLERNSKILETIELLVAQVKEIKDFRKPQGTRYKLYNLLAIFTLAVIAGADDYVAISAYAKSKKDFLLKHHLLDGKRYPSHDLFRTVLQNLDRDAFSHLLASWLSLAVANQKDLPDQQEVEAKMIHIDGKSLRASRHSNQHSRSALQIVTAYCSNDSISVGQQIIDKKSCEKKAIPQLIKMLDLKDTVVTIDAIASTKKNAALIIGKGADYLLALKKNNKLFYQEVEDFFNLFSDTALMSDVFETKNKAHGRDEIRSCSIISALKFFPDAEEWEGLKSIICVDAQRTINNKTSKEKRFYLSSLAPNAEALNRAVRKHWTVENQLHWSLDVAFNEDRCRIKNKNAAANFAALRRFALALLKNAKISKLGIKNQRLQAAWSDDFLEKLFLFFKENIIL